MKFHEKDTFLSSNGRRLSKREFLCEPAPETEKNEIKRAVLTEVHGVVNEEVSNRAVVFNLCYPSWCHKRVLKLTKLPKPCDIQGVK